MKYIFIIIFIFIINCSGNKVSNYHGVKSLDVKFSELKLKTTNKNESIDNINLKDFIKELKKIKLLFSSEKDLITFAKKIFKKMGIKDNTNSSIPHYIKSRYKKYDLIVKTNGKTPDECRDYILKNLK